MPLDIKSTLETISKIKDAVKQFLPPGQQAGIFQQLDSLTSALQQNKEDLQSADPFRNRAHAAFTWAVEWIVVYNYFIRDVFINIVQLFGKHVVVTPIDNTTIITLVSLVLFGKAIFSGFDLVDKIKQRVATVAKTIEEKTDDSSSTNSPT
jgi:hypothetical protein